MAKQLLRYSDLCAAGIVNNRMQLSRLVAREEFPAGFKLSENTRVWDATEVATWVDQRRAQRA